MVALLAEPFYGRSVWGQNLIAGLVNRLKSKRILYRQVAAMQDIPAGCRYMFVIGTDSDWVKSILESADQKGISPILISNDGCQRFSCRYSAVCSDDVNSMRDLIRRLSARDKRRIGLYGVNPQSLSDLSRLNGYRAALSPDAVCVYYNHASLAQCYEDFFHQPEWPDAVICTNGFAAVSLVRHLQADRPDAMQKMLIISCQESRLADCCAGKILNVHLDYCEYGKAAVLLYETIRKADYLSHIVMRMKWNMQELEQWEKPGSPIAVSAEKKMLSTSAASFYHDTELSEMMHLERLCHELSPEDAMILNGLLAGCSCTAIAMKYYLTPSTVKYRIRRMMNACGLKDRARLLELIRQYGLHFPAGE